MGFADHADGKGVINHEEGQLLRDNRQDLLASSLKILFPERPQ